MENYFQYNDPIRIVWRSGSSSEPYVDKVESQKVINNMVILSEIPDEFTHVSISGYTEIYEGTPSATQFIVNYESGIINFHSSKEGSTITNMTYKGRGFILYPASRIYGHNENPNVTVTLQQIIDNGNDAVEALRELSKTIAKAEVATANAITQSAYAKTQGDHAKTQGDYSKTQGDYAKAQGAYATSQGDYAKVAGDALVFKGTYAAGMAYVARNMVYYNGATYMAVLSTTGNLPTNVTYWKKIGSMVWKGTYTTGTTYTYGDFVTDGSNYNLYMSTSESNVGNALTNTAFWSKMISVQSVVDATILATANANTATANANAARDAANTAASAANASKTKADTATSQANTARDSANTAATNANDKADYAQSKGDYAKDVGDSLTHKGDYNVALAYIVRNIVYYNGCTYMCIVNSAAGTLPTNATYWKKISAFNWRGTYSASATYQYGDFIVDATAQKLYMCTKDGTTSVQITNVANWTPIFDISSVVATANASIAAANTARDAANAAASAANSGKANADTAAASANAAKVAADASAENADSKAAHAKAQGDYAKTQGDYAKAQGSAANASKVAADTATGLANIATDQANAARDAANTSKTSADTATGLANVATTNANKARDSANTAATNANEVASRTVSKGAYKASTTYYPNNIVTYNGSSYICIVQALNKVPTDTGFWELVAMKGNDGLGSVVNVASSNGDLVVAGTIQTPNLSISTSLKTLWNDKYTKTEVDALLSQTVSNIQWKSSVETFSDIAKTYPNPQDGWTVNVNDTDYTYRYTGSAWVAISANSIPNASSSSDGKMSIDDFNKLKAITAQATRTVNSPTNGNILVNGAESVVYTHPTGAGNNHIPTGGAANNFLRYGASGTAVWATPTLAGLSDTTITSPTAAQILRFNGTSWVNSSLTFADVGEGTSNGTLVTNLNADMLDGLHADDLQNLRTWDGQIKVGIWSRILAFGGISTIGHSFLLNVTGTRGNVVYNATFSISTSHGVPGGGIVQLSGNTYSIFSLRLVVDAQGNGFVEMKDDNAFTTELQRVQVNATRLRNTPLTPITIFTDGTTLPVGSMVGAAITSAKGGVMVAERFLSNVPDGISPFAVNSPTLVKNLNVDMVDGMHVDTWSNANTIVARDSSGNTTAMVYKSHAGQGTAPMLVSSKTRVDNFNADLVDGYHADDFTRRINLDGQVQTTSYRRSVIALCEVTNTNPSFDSYSNGIITFHRRNGLSGQINATISAEKAYNTTKFNYSSIIVGNNVGGIRPCTFTYNGIKYGGIEVYLSDAEYQFVEFNGATNFDIFGLDYLVNNTGAILNAEVNGSLNFDEVHIYNNFRVGSRSLEYGGVANSIALRDGSGNLNAVRFVSTTGTGTSPIAVASTTKVDNFNADMVDGYHLDQDVRSTASPTFEVAKVGALGIGNQSFVKQFDNMGFLARTANQKIDLYFTGQMTGYVDVTISGAWYGNDNSGLLTKRFIVYTQRTTDINRNMSKYIEVAGNIRNTFAIGELSWDAANKRWKIPIAYIGDSGYPETIAIRVEGMSVSGKEPTEIGITERYTTDTAVFPKATIGTDAYTLDGYRASDAGLSVDSSTVAVRNAYGNLHAMSLVANVAQGTPPIYVSSTTLVTNLNAQLLNGRNSDQYYQFNVNNPSLTDANALTTSGIYGVSATFTGSPFSGTNGGNQGYLEHISWSPGVATYCMQRHTPVNTFISTRYRIKNNGVWGAWRTIWDSANGGSDSGLDADMVDGAHVGDSANNIVKRSGDGWIGAVGFSSSAPQGTAPFYVNSTTVTARMNADMVDGYHFNQGLQTNNSPVFASLSLNGMLSMASNAPIIQLLESDQALNEKAWWVVVDAKSFQVRTITDAAGSGATAMSIQRGTGTAIGSIGFGANVSAPYFQSTVSTGTPPIVVASTTVVTNFNADMVDGYQAILAATANSIPVRDARNKIAQVSAVRTVVSEVQLTTTNATTVATHTATVSAMFTVNIYLRVAAAGKSVSIAVNYTSLSGAQSRKVITSQALGVDDYDFVPITLNAQAGTIISVVGTTSAASNVFISAIITEEG